jgi:hypothetical protein
VADVLVEDSVFTGRVVDLHRYYCSTEIEMSGGTRGSYSQW